MNSYLKLIFFTLALAFTSLLHAQTGGSWQGTWNSDFGELRLHQNGSKVFGDYSNVGFLEGTLSGSTVRGTFDNKGKKGSFEFSISPDKKNIKGKWAWGTATPSGAWNATLKSNEKPILVSVPFRTKSLRYRLTLDNIWIASVDDGPEGIFSGYELYGIGWCRAFDRSGKQITPFDVRYTDKYGRFWEIFPKNYIKTDISTRPYLIGKAITFDFPLQPNESLDDMMRNTKIELTIELKDYDTASSSDILGKERVTIPLNEASIPAYTGNTAPSNKQGFGYLHITHGKGHIIVTYHVERL